MHLQILMVTKEVCESFVFSCVEISTHAVYLCLFVEIEKHCLIFNEVFQGEHWCITKS